MLTLRKIQKKLRRARPSRRRADIERNIGKREVCDRIKSLVSGDLLLRVYEFDGEFYVDPRSDLPRRILLTGQFEPELAGIAIKVIDPNKDIVDVGANVGFYAVLLAKKLERGRKVAAFEPDEEAYRKLVRNLSHNEVGENVIALPYGASDAGGSGVLYHVNGRSEYSSLNPIVHPSASDEATTCQSVVTVRVDEVVNMHKLSPGFMKVDVEGAEHLVLAGAQRTIQRYRPVVLMELSDQLLRSAGSSAGAVVERMLMNDYVVVDPIKPALKPGSRAFGDIICFPREDERWRALVQQ